MRRLIEGNRNISCKHKFISVLCSCFFTPVIIATVTFEFDSFYGVKLYLCVYLYYHTGWDTYA